MLKVTDLCAFYDDVQVLYNIDLEICAGEIVTILGSNGAGKTTLMKTICGIVTRRKGRIAFQDEDIMKIPAYKLVSKGLTLVPEGRHLFPTLSVRENILLGAYSIQNKPLIEETYEWIMEMFPRLKERSNQLAGTMSGGEQQMCAIARALLSNPSFLMLDEPSLGLAPNIVDMVFEVIEKINREKGITVVVVEQNANIALEYANRGYVMENGEIKMSGTSKELLESEDIQKVYLGL